VVSARAKPARLRTDAYRMSGAAPASGIIIAGMGGAGGDHGRSSCSTLNG